MTRHTPNYLKLHIEPETGLRTTPVEAYRGLPSLCQAFEQATGWKLRHTPGPGRDDTLSAAWSAPLWHEGDLPAGHLCLEAGNDRPAAPVEQARSLAGGVVDLLNELSASRTVVWQREAELAAGVPIVTRNDEPRQLAQRLEAVLKAGAESVGCQAAGLYMLDAQTTQLKVRSVWGLSRQRFLDPPRPLSTATADLEALSGHAVVVEKASLSQSWHVPEPFGAAVCVPVSSSTVPLGTLWLFSDSERTFSDLELNVIEVVAGRLAAELERQMLLVESQGSHQLKRQLASARDLWQNRAHRAKPLLEGWDLAGWSEHAQEVGGAFYDWQMHASGAMTIALGEAAASGVVAALSAHTLRASLKAHAEYTLQPHLLLERVNRALWSQSAGDQLASLWCATLEPATGLVCHAWSGLPGVIRLKSVAEHLAAEPRLALGREPESIWAQHQMVLEPGEVMVILSDSIRRMLDQSGRPLDIPALTSMLVDHLTNSATELSEMVHAFLESHDLSPESEDRAVLVVKRCS